MIALAGPVVLLFILPALVFCTNINRWLTKTHNNIVRLSRGEMNIDRNDAFYSRELIAISDAIQQLRQYQLDKVSLESEKQLLIKELEASSFLDPLTNIYNRRKFFLECQLLGDSSYPQAFCLIDIDNFKQLNDSYGHDVVTGRWWHSATCCNARSAPATFSAATAAKSSRCCWATVRWTTRGTSWSNCAPVLIA